MDKIRIRDFVMKSSPEEPKTATYKKSRIVSDGEGGNRHISFYKNDELLLYMWVDTHCSSACYVHSERGPMAYILPQLYMRHARFDGWFWFFKTWDDFEEFFVELINF